MKRNLENLQEYKQTCRKVIDRADNLCEVEVDEHRCCKYISTDNVKYINFLHTETRNGKSDMWILDPKNIIFGCASHHIEEERSGIRVKKYKQDGELNYIPNYD